MKAIGRLRVYHLLIILLLMTSFFFIVEFYIETPNWGWLIEIERSHLYIPPLFYIIIGIVISIWLMNVTTSWSWRRNVDVMASALQRTEEGRLDQAKQEIKRVDADFNIVVDRFTQVNERLKEQAKRSQRLVDDWSENEKALKQEIVEQERNRLARELHDSVSQQLYAASMLLSAHVEQQKGKNEALALQQIEKTITDAQSDLRSMLFQLRPIQLENKSFSEGIRQFTERLRQYHALHFHVSVTDEAGLLTGIEDQLFRIAQEAVANVVRHANASTVDIFYQHVDGIALLKVTDDGVGFIVHEQSLGYGLASMKERAEEMGGTLKLMSVPNRGTSIEVRVPLIEKEEGDE